MVAKLSPRTAGPRTMAADGYATIGAGNRADGAATEIVGGYALDRDERIDGRFAYQAYQARVGKQADGQVLHLGLAEVIRQNQQNRYGAEPGALGSALHAAGRRTAVVGNADAHGLRDRSAALAVMGRDGSVDRGQVSSKLIKADPTSPFGYELSPLAVADAFDTAWRTSDLTLVEASDLERVDAFEELALPEAWQKLRRDALRDADELLGELLDRVDLSSDLVLVVTPAVPRKGEELGIFAMAGPGVQPGVAVSGSTRRNGYLTLPDIAPTILERFGVPAPLSMTGTPIRLGQARPVDRAMIDDYVRANELSVFRDRVTGPVTVVFIVLLALAYLLAGLALVLRGRLGDRWRRTTRGLLLAVLAIPPVTFLSGLIPYDRLGPVGYVAVLLLGAAGVGITWRRLLLVGLLTLATLAVFAMVDVSRPPEARTHLGRLVTSDSTGLSILIQRKLFANLNILTSSIWTWVVPIAVAFLIVLSLRRFGPTWEASPNGRPSAPATSALGALRRGLPGMRACLWGALVVAVLGFALNDSGIAVPAMMSTVLLPYLGYMILREPVSWVEPDEPARQQLTEPAELEVPQPAPQT
jgi:hypothetical protein